LAETAAPGRRSQPRATERRLQAAECRQAHIHNNAEQFVTPRFVPAFHLIAVLMVNWYSAGQKKFYFSTVHNKHGVLDTS
jgi:hypothetical protein